MMSRSARSDERSEENDNAKIPDLVRIDAGEVRSALSKHEGEQHSKCGKSSVGRNENGADVKEDRMHLSKNSSVRCR